MYISLYYDKSEGQMKTLGVVIDSLIVVTLLLFIVFLAMDMGTTWDTWSVRVTVYDRYGKRTKTEPPLIKCTPKNPDSWCQVAEVR